jgi:23S rRNA (adenine2503-C2)-methyltransferase
MHETKACNTNNLLTENGYTHFYPYKKVEEDLKNEGFDVLVFIPSIEEDQSRITCGNAILSDNFSYFKHRGDFTH